MAEPRKSVDELAHQVIGAAIEVHRILGPGFLESVYEEALTVELDLRKIPYERQKPIALQFKGHTVGDSRLDFLVGNELVMEIKANSSNLPRKSNSLFKGVRTRTRPDH